MLNSELVGSGWLIWWIFSPMARFDEICFPGVFFFWKTSRFFTIKKETCKQTTQSSLFIFFRTNKLGTFQQNPHPSFRSNIFSFIFNNWKVWKCSPLPCPLNISEHIDQHNVRWKMWYLRGDIVPDFYNHQESKVKVIICVLQLRGLRNTEAFGWSCRTVGKASLLLNFKFIEEEFGKMRGETCRLFWWSQRK